MATPGNTVRLDGYQLRLPVFEGPLDVLLRMIEREQLAITDVSLVAVTEQFLEYVGSLADVPPSVLADFAATAARLLALKARSLLPAPPKAEAEPEPDDLTQQLAAYQTARDAAEALRKREEAGHRSWPRALALQPALPVSERLVASPPASLAAALRRCLSRTTPPPAVHRPAPVITVAAMTRRLLQRLGGGWSRFSDLHGAAACRTERTVAFIALLSLVRQRVVEARQEALFGEIEVATLMQAAADDD